MKTKTNFLSSALLLAIASSALATTRYVDVNSTNATPPYTNWTTAATNIQDAVDAAVAGDEIVVTNGTYGPVSVNKRLNVESVNGAQFTSIDGLGAFRGAYLTNGASLSGFTLTQGSAEYGAGAYGGTLSNCTLYGNETVDLSGDITGYGGGAFGCTLNNCTLTYNLAGVGGGAYQCTLNNCMLSLNAVNSVPGGPAPVYGGAAYSCTLNNCVVTGNSADDSLGSTHPGAYGGGAAYSTLNNCTLTGNEAAGYGFGGGAYDCTLNNSIVYLNTAPSGADCYLCGLLNHCWTGDPLFVGNLRLQSNSPCINAGNNAFAPAGPDLDGNPRIVGGSVDIGAYEYQSLSLLNFGVVSNQAGFNITGQSNQVVIVETSTDLTNWSSLATNTLNGHPFPFSDPAPATMPRRIYRAQAQ